MLCRGKPEYTVLAPELLDWCLGIGCHCARVSDVFSTHTCIDEDEDDDDHNKKQKKNSLNPHPPQPPQLHTYPDNLSPLLKQIPTQIQLRNLGTNILDILGLLLPPFTTT